MDLRSELLKSIWYAFTSLDVEKCGKVSKSQLKVSGDVVILRSGNWDPRGGHWTHRNTLWQRCSSFKLLFTAEEQTLTHLSTQLSLYVVKCLRCTGESTCNVRNSCHTDALQAHTHKSKYLKKLLRPSSRTSYQLLRLELRCEPSFSFKGKVQLFLCGPETQTVT